MENQCLGLVEELALHQRDGSLCMQAKFTCR
jgi:hypothetical protein